MLGFETKFRILEPGISLNARHNFYSRQQKLHLNCINATGLHFAIATVYRCHAAISVIRNNLKM